jgi:hypothetical protein
VTPASPRSTLAAIVRTVAVPPVSAVEISDRVGVDMRGAIVRARAGKPINAGAYLALCGALGVDPLNGSPRPMKHVPSRVAWPMVGADAKAMRRQQGRT